MTTKPPPVSDKQATKALDFLITKAEQQREQLVTETQRGLGLLKELDATITVLQHRRQLIEGGLATADAINALRRQVEQLEAGRRTQAATLEHLAASVEALSSGQELAP